MTVLSPKKFMERIQKECIDRYKNILNGMIDDTAKNEIEYGAEFCVEKYRESDITLGQVCEGNSCSVSLRNCDDKHAYGSFHTHPNEMQEIKHSEQDIFSEVLKDHAFFCIGGKVTGPNNIKKNQIKCFTINNESDIGWETLEELRNKHPKLADSAYDFVNSTRKLIKSVEDGSSYYHISPHDMKLLRYVSRKDNYIYPEKIEPFIDDVKEISDDLYKQGNRGDILDIPDKLKRYVKLSKSKNKFIRENYDKIIEMDQIMDI